MWRWPTRSCSTKTWNVIRFNLTKGAGLVVNAQFRAARSLECNSIQINKTNWVYPLGQTASPSDQSAHSENAAVKAVSHSMIFDIPMRPLRENQKH